MSARMPGYTCLPGCQDTHVCQDKLVLGGLGEEGAKPTLLPERLADPEIIIFFRDPLISLQGPRLKAHSCRDPLILLQNGGFQARLADPEIHELSNPSSPAPPARARAEG